MPRSWSGAALASTLLAVLPRAAIVPGALLVLAVLVAGLWRCTGRGLPALLHVGIDRRITVTGCDGRSRAGAILDDSYVGAVVDDHRLASRTDAVVASGDRPSSCYPTCCRARTSRRLRVALRYGRPASATAATSDVDAG